MKKLGVLGISKLAKVLNLKKAHKLQFFLALIQKLHPSFESERIIDLQFKCLLSNIRHKKLSLYIDILSKG